MGRAAFDIEGDDGLDSLTGTRDAADKNGRSVKALHYVLPSFCFTKKFKWCCGCSVFLIIVIIVVVVSVAAVQLRNVRVNGLDSVRFIVIGGTGVEGFTSQLRVAAGLAAHTNATGTVPQPSFVISTGDSFPAGLSNATDPAFRQYFTGVYAQPQMQALPWNVVLGETDFMGNATTLVNAASRDSRFVVRRTGYTMRLIFPGSDTWKVAPPALAAVAFLDTPPWISATRIQRVAYPSADYSDLRPAVPSPRAAAAARNATAGNVTSSNVTAAPAVNATAAWAAWETAQLQSLDAALGATWAQAAFWRVVVGHDCIISAGPSGVTPELSRIQALLRQRRVGLYICGHDPDMQVFGADSGDLAYLVSGAGSISDSISLSAANTTGLGAPLLSLSGDPGFLSIRMHPDSVDVDIVGASGATVSSTKIRNPLFTL